MYLKQQTQKDPRAYDVICAADKENQAILGTNIEKCSPSEFQQHYEACINALKAKRGKLRDHQLRELLGTYKQMKVWQQANESVADFAHRETQHELEKLLPSIHRTPEATPDKDGNTEVELIFAFAIKLRESISKELISRDFDNPSLQSIIEAAERYEVYGFSRVTHDQDLSPSWRPDAFILDIIWLLGLGLT